MIELKLEQVSNGYVVYDYTSDNYSNSVFTNPQDVVNFITNKLIVTSEGTQ